jgi:chromosome segregation ATPase
MSLEESLATLTAALPELPQHVGRLLSSLGTAVADGEALMKSSADKREQAVALMEQVDEVLDGVVEQGADHQSKLDQASEALRTAFQGLDAVEAAQAEVTAGIEAAGQTMNGFQQQLAATAAAVQSAEDEAAQQIAALGDQARAGREEVQAAVQAAASEADALSQAAAGARDRVRSELASLKELMTSLMEQARAALAETEDELRSAVGQQEAALTDAAAHIGQGTSDLIQDVEQAIVTEMQERLVQGAGEVLAALGALGADAAAATGASSSVRQVLEGQFGDLGEQVAPLQDAIAAIKAAAATVGID